jgi:hypothetical protein
MSNLAPKARRIYINTFENLFKILFTLADMVFLSLGEELHKEQAIF